MSGFGTSIMTSWPLRKGRSPNRSDTADAARSNAAFFREDGEQGRHRQDAPGRIRTAAPCRKGKVLADRERGEDVGRLGNVGDSEFTEAVVDPFGRIVDRIDAREVGTLVARFHQPPAPTHRERLALVGLVALGAAAGAAAASVPRKRTRGEP